MVTPTAGARRRGGEGVAAAQPRAPSTRACLGVVAEDHDHDRAGPLPRRRRRAGLAGGAPGFALLPGCCGCSPSRWSRLGCSSSPRCGAVPRGPAPAARPAACPRAAPAEALLLARRGPRPFYTRQPRRLLLSIAFHFAAWVLGTLARRQLILRFLDVDVSLALATVIEAFATRRPGRDLPRARQRRGAEGGVARCSALGIGVVHRRRLRLVRRVREVVWVAVGLALFAVSRRPIVATSSPPD